MTTTDELPYEHYFTNVAGKVTVSVFFGDKREELPLDIPGVFAGDLFETVLAFLHRSANPGDRVVVQYDAMADGPEAGSRWFDIDRDDRDDAFDAGATIILAYIHELDVAFGQGKTFVA